jgi:DNA-binding Lrp family transcriptional regulator
MEFEGVVLIETKPTKTKEITSKIKKIANRIFEVSGTYDIAALIKSYTIEELNEKIDEIRKITSVKKTDTLIKLKD